MMAAIAAANTSIKDTEITILERRDRIGRKILATGNGKCNLGNTDFSPKRDYRSHDPYRLPEFFARFQTSDTIRFFEERGLYLTEKNGYLYPYSGQASTVLDFFREELERKKVRIVCDCRIQKLCMQKSGWQVFTDQGQYHFDRLIISCGTAAGIPPKEALGTGSLTAAFAFKQYPYLPALTALRCEEKFYKSIAGVRCPAAITVEIPGRKKLCESGELQLTDYGISGIPVFQLSAAVSEALQTNKKISASIDFFPAVPLSKWNEFCCRQYQACCGKHVRFLAQGILPSKLAQLFIERSPLKAQDIGIFDAAEYARFKNCRNWHKSGAKRAGLHRRNLLAGGNRRPGSKAFSRSVSVRRAARCGRSLRRLQPPVGMDERTDRGNGGCARGMKLP